MKCNASSDDVIVNSSLDDTNEGGSKEGPSLPINTRLERGADCQEGMVYLMTTMMIVTVKAAVIAVVGENMIGKMNPLIRWDFEEMMRDDTLYPNSYRVTRFGIDFMVNDINNNNGDSGNLERKSQHQHDYLLESAATRNNNASSRVGITSSTQSQNMIR